MFEFYGTPCLLSEGAPTPVPDAALALRFRSKHILQVNTQS